MRRRPPRSTRTDTLFPYTTLFRSLELAHERHLQTSSGVCGPAVPLVVPARSRPASPSRATRSEEHTSELQSLMRISYAVFCLKKKIKKIYDRQHVHAYQNKQDTDNYLTHITQAITLKNT